MEQSKSRLRCQKAIGFGQVYTKFDNIYIFLIKNYSSSFIAIWMLPTRSVYGGWPKSGEIDIVETLGNADFSCNGGAIGRQLAGQTLHWGPSTTQNGHAKTHWQKYIHANLLIKIH